MPKPVTNEKLSIILSEYDMSQNFSTEIFTSTTTPFSFTLRKVTNAAKSTKEDYKTKLQKFKDMGIAISDTVYERNEVNNGIHCHGVMQIPKKFNMKRFRTRGWNFKADEIYDYAGWLSYMTKQNVLESVFSEDEPVSPCFKMPTAKLF